MHYFRADLHIHSRFSRATSRSLNPRTLAAWGRAKGLAVLGTGDFTHPQWFEELDEQLVLDPASGLYRLREPKHLERELPWLEGYSLPGQTLFMLQGEISSIYKRGDKVRKVHNLVFMPNLEAAAKFNKVLDGIGNIASDGRPILGLDSRDLLEIVLETDPLAFLVPAHIWTPWFSVFGSKSGFDSLEECFGDLTSHIFALETGLSSDPEMNWMLSALDRYRLISNSDAHSGEKLGREANLFSGDISYEGIYRSLRGEALGHKFLGTVEFFPEEGKYHLDGHRKCGVVMEPRETLERGGLCPVCGKSLTVGVLHRVLALADRDTPEQPSAHPGYTSLIPLQEICSEVVGTGPNTKKAKALYARLITRFGSEMSILQETPPEDLARVSAPLAEGIARMRRGEVHRSPGFDGQFGVIKVFSERERKELKSGRTLSLAGRAPDEPAPREQRALAQGALASAPSRRDLEDEEEDALAKGLNEEQAAAAEAGPGPVLVLAGPGTGKTHTLMGRIAHLMRKGVNPRRILAVTFTRKAAEEMDERLIRHFGDQSSIPRADTLHALAFEYWTKAYDEAPVILNEDGARRAFLEANSGPGCPPAKRLRAMWERLSYHRETMGRDVTDEERENGEQAECFHRYVKHKESWNLSDYTDLLEFWLEQIQSRIYLCPYTHVLVDEIQDLSPLQLEVIHELVAAKRHGDAADPDQARKKGQGGEGFFAIGDPKQSIYGFRGAVADVRERLEHFWPNLQVVSLSSNYRSRQNLLDLSERLLPSESGPLTAVLPGECVVRLFEATTAASEAAWIGDHCRRLLGSTSHSLSDQESFGEETCPEEAALHGSLSPGDIAILVRFKALAQPIARTLARLGIPCSMPESEAFWADPRVALILDTAGAFHGISPGFTPPEEQNGDPEDDEGPDLSIPDKILLKGPMGLSAYLQDMPPFDRLFWSSREFKTLVKAYDEHGGWLGLLNWVHLRHAVEMVRRRSESVQIITAHAAKGLEFRVVFLPALESGIVPFLGPAFLTGKVEQGKTVDEEEERRLFYVAMTRARDGLYMSLAAKRMVFGRELRLKGSPLVKDLVADGGDTIRRSTLVARTRQKHTQLSLM